MYTYLPRRTIPNTPPRYPLSTPGRTTIGVSTPLPSTRPRAPASFNLPNARSAASRPTPAT
ncbi:MAG TPA: NlpC/P60 family protein, partial [Phycisphaerae bacterium]|nr:NlpC/P60 family protein [Phycisphaerae bacterium]